jgi:hypothetical protein
MFLRARQLSTHRVTASFGARRLEEPESCPERRIISVSNPESLF